LQNDESNDMTFIKYYFHLIW